MAESFTLSVDVDADMAPFRRTLKAELDAAQKQGATIPVGAMGGAAANSAVVPPGAATATAPPGVAATGASVAQQSAQAAANAAARAVGTPAAGWPGGWQAWGAPAGAGGGGGGAGWPGGWQGWGAPVGVPVGGGGPVPAGTPGQPAGTPQQMPPVPIPVPGPGPGPGRPGRRRAGFFGGGERFITGAYVANAAGRLIENEMDYGAALRAAGSSPEDIIAADIRYRQGIIESFPVAGRLGGALNDIFTGGTEPIDRTLRQARLQNDATDRMKRIGGMQRRWRDLGDMAGARGAALSRLEAEAQFQSSTFDIREEWSATAEAQADVFRRQRDEVEIWDKATPLSAGGTPEEKARRLAAITQAENDSVSKLKARFGPMVSSAEAVKRRSLIDVDRGVNLRDYINSSQELVSRLRTRNQPFFASMAERWTATTAEIFQADPENRPGVARRGLQQLAEDFTGMAREFGHTQRQLSAQQRINQRVLERDPLGARIASIEADRDEAIKEANALPWGFRQLRQWSIRRGARQEADIARQEDSDSRQLRLQSLDNRREHFDLLAEGKPFTARARDIQRETEEDVAQMRQSQRFSAEEIKKRIESGISEEKALQFELKRRQNAGFGMEAAPFSMGPGANAGNTTEPVVEGLRNVKTAIEDLKKALTGS